MEAGISGFAPTVKIAPPMTEREKYELMWDRDEYRAIAPGEFWAMSFLEHARPERHAEVIDFGCGTGRGALMLALVGMLKVTMVDFARNCLDPEVAQACETQASRIRFVQADLTKTIGVNAAYGYCCDVMEHIPTEDVDTVLQNILISANHCFFTISTVQDHCGEMIGEHLHMTVQPMSWWIEKIRTHGAVIHWTRELEDVCMIYCSSWHEASDIIKIGHVNQDERIVEDQVAWNTRAGWMQVMPHDKQDREVLVLAGGPTMNDCLDEIRALREAGAALVTCNGAYHWAIEKGLSISAQIVLDSREFNARFTKPVLDKCKYLIASQVHSSTLDGLPRDRTYLWNSGISEANENLIRELTGYYFPVPGGSTVVLRSLALLRILGFWKIHLFGFDSCVKPNGQHHAYDQAENDNELLIPVTCGGKTFECTPWMVSQASEFRDVVKFLGDEVEIAVHGDGLIAAIIENGASFSQLKEH